MKSIIKMKIQGNNMVYKRKSLLLIILSLLVLSCTAPIVSVLERDNQRVGLSQIQRKTDKKRKNKAVIDTTQIYSEETKKKLKDGFSEYEKDETGEDILSVSLADVQIVAKSKNIAERAGKIAIDFKVDVPAALINNKWQVQLSPVAYKNEKKIYFDKILLSGAQFLKQQEYGYRMYQNFISSIIPDSVYMQQLFDAKGYQKALFEIEEQFYYSWKKEQLSQMRFVDWRNVRNRRNLLFNGVMERNRSTVKPFSWKKVLPAYWLERDMNNVPGHWNNFLSPEYNLEQKVITREDSIEISKRFFDYKRLEENERKKALVNEKYNDYVRFPKEPCRLDTIIRVGDKFEYYYSQEIEADENIKKIDVTIDGEVVALDESRYTLPQSDTLTYYISSMVQFLDHAPRYKRIIVSRHATANQTAFINYKAGSSHFDEQIGSNKEEIDKVMETMHKLTFTGELVLDSVDMCATSSPEGSDRLNMNLSRQRAKELKSYLLQRTSDKEAIALFQANAIGEDWAKLMLLIRNDKNISERNSILNAINSISDNDEKEIALRNFKDYDYIRKELYPQLRAVNFQFHLHRREMVKDTIHTTVIDTVYMDAIKLLENRQYKAALPVLSEYDDHNTAVCLMSLGYDKQAIEILSSLPKNGDTLYLLSILYVREKSFNKAIEAFREACELDSSKWFRGNLDPEIYQLINDYNLNFEQ